MIDKPRNLSAQPLGKLYVVATPIGNLNDFSARAQKTLQNVSWIACEDTRHCKPLLKHYTIPTRCVAYHNFNEQKQMLKLVELLMKGEDGAIISDAGTPLINDPGFHLVSLAREQGIEVIAIPGPCAVVSALSILAIDQGSFYFEGFLPANRSARLARIKKLANMECQLVFYEAPHRIVQMFEDINEVLGEERPAGIARELTKLYESSYRGTCGSILADLLKGNIIQKGEFVVVIKGCDKAKAPWEEAQQKLIEGLLPLLPINKVAKVVSQLTDVSRKACYEQALLIQDKQNKK